MAYSWKNCSYLKLTILKRYSLLSNDVRALSEMMSSVRYLCTKYNRFI